MSPVPLSDGAPLDERERARGRRLAITSHPAGMTHRMVFTEHLTTLALLALGAGEALVGLQRGVVYLSVLLQLPILRLVGRVSKRRLLVAGQCVALAGSVPLLFFGGLAALEPPRGVVVALVAFAVAAAGFSISETVWFPLLHGYQERARIGRFFGTLRTGWHLSLIVYFLGAQRWLEAHPGDFAPLFGLGFALGLVRVVLIARLPERSERTGAVIHVREAVALLRAQPLLRRYLAGIATAGAVRSVVFTFAVVMMRRVVGFSEGQILYTTVAIFTGGLATLLLWGRVVDRVGPYPVFRWAALGQAALILGFLFVSESDTASLTLAVALFFGLWALGAGFDVADTHVIFQLAPEDAPARTLVVARVTETTFRGAAPLLVGAGLGWLLATQLDPLSVYRALFVACAVVQILAIWPLRAFRGSL